VADAAADRVLELMADDQRLQELTAALAELTDKQRRALSGRVREQAERFSDERQARALAVLGCVTGVRQVASALWFLELHPASEQLAVEVLRARQPHWLPDLPAALLVGKETNARAFRLIRALVRAGLVERPDFPEYALSMVWGLDVGRGWEEHQLGPSVLECLRADSGLLDDELWALLATEGAGKDLTNYDAWLHKPYRHNVHYGTDTVIPPRPHRTWQHALTTLAADGTIGRSRLLDEILASFLRDWAANDVSWFVALHDALAPTLDELEARQDRYGRVLAVAPGQPVSMALRSFTSLHKAGRLDVAVFLAAAPVVLGRGDKGPVVAALKLLEDLACQQPDTGAQVAGVVGEALTHDRVDVQERALALLTRLVPDPAERQMIVDRAADALAPSMRTATALEAPSVVSDEPPPLDQESPTLIPIGDPDELAELLGRLAEEADGPAEVERLLAGVARLADQRPRHGVSALVQRLHELASSYYPGAWTGEDLRADLVQLGLVWLDNGRPGRGYGGRQYDTKYDHSGAVISVIPMRRPDWSLPALVTMRIHEIASAVATGGRTLLSAPDRRDGSLSADTLNARVAATGRMTKPLPLDAGLALLRVPPTEHPLLRLPSAHRTAALLSDQLRLLKQHRPAWELVIGTSHGQHRTDRYDTAATWRDRNAPAGAVDRLVAAALDRRDPLPSLGLEAGDGEDANRFEQITAMWPVMLPHHTDLLAAHAHPRLVRALTKNRSGTEPLLDGIGASRHPVGGPAQTALLLGMSAKNGVERTRAVDALADLAVRRRLDGSALGTQLSRLLTAGAVVGTRVITSLSEAARTGGATGAVVLDALTAALPSVPGRRDAHHFVDLLAQLAVAHGRTVSLPDDLRRAAQTKGSTALQKACRRVPVPA
jgi:hypothetical protein